MRRLCVLLVLVCTACGAPDATSPTGATPSPTPIPWPTPYPEQGNRPPIYVLLHIWYQPAESCPTVGDPADHWLRWIWPPKVDNPCQTIPGAPWLRQISSTAYPLTGPYDSRNEDVLRWQIRQAQAGGIDGFFACVYSWSSNLAYTYDLFFGNSEKGIKGLLQIAHEERFKVGIEGWGPNGPGSEVFREPWTEEITRHLAAVETSPYRDAYITIDGRLAYWLIDPRQWMTEDERIAFFDGTPENPRSVTWLLRDAKPSLRRVIALNERLKHSRAQYVSWKVLPDKHGWYHNPGFADDLNRIIHEVPPELGMIPVAHTYTGYDERAGVTNGPFEGRHGLREGTTFIRTFLENAVSYGARVILGESFNEWGEGSMLESGLNIVFWRNMDQEVDLYLDESGADAPYVYLDIFRQFNGMQEWVPPRPPPCSIIDPLLRSRGGPPIDFQCVNADGRLELAW